VIFALQVRRLTACCKCF